MTTKQSEVLGTCPADRIPHTKCALRDWKPVAVPEKRDVPDNTELPDYKAQARVKVFGMFGEGMDDLKRELIGCEADLLAKTAECERLQSAIEEAVKLLEPCPPYSNTDGRNKMVEDSSHMNLQPQFNPERGVGGIQMTTKQSEVLGTCEGNKYGAFHRKRRPHAEEHDCMDWKPVAAPKPVMDAEAEPKFERADQIIAAYDAVGSVNWRDVAISLARQLVWEQDACKCAPEMAEMLKLMLDEGRLVRVAAEELLKKAGVL